VITEAKLFPATRAQTPLPSTLRDLLHPITTMLGRASLGDRLAAWGANAFPRVLEELRSPCQTLSWSWLDPASLYHLVYSEIFLRRRKKSNSCFSINSHLGKVVLDTVIFKI